MTEREQSIQQLDPLGGVVVRPLIYVSAVGLVAWATVVKITHWGDVNNVPLTVVGLALLVLAVIVVVYATSPLRAPLRLPVHLTSVSLAFAASTINAVSVWDGNTVIRDDWGPTAIAVVILMLAPFRPAQEIATVGLFAALFAGFVALLQADAIGGDLPPIVDVIIAVTPILILSLGGAAFASVLIGNLQRWNLRAAATMRSLSDEEVDGITRSVQQERVTILNRDVVPFFAEVLDRADVLDSDRDRAAQIAESIRGVMVAEVDRSWLDLVVDRAATSRGHEHGSESIQDPDQLAPAMTTDQRTALRAAIVAVFAHPSFDPDGFDIAFARVRDRCEVTVRADFGVGDSNVRSTLAPYLAVLRVVFVDLSVDFMSPTLIVRFSYDEH